METKFNSQICTTKEQSERLLALGLKKETADMALHFSCVDLDGNAYYIPYTIGHQCTGIPAWSLHRLFQIYTNNVPYSSWNMALFDWTDEMIEGVVKKEEIEFTEEDKYWCDIMSESDPTKDMGEVSDGYHTFNELYEYRLLYNASMFNELAKQNLYDVHKSKRHSDGEIPFGDPNWFIVMAELPTGQISNHYEMKDWDLFDIPEKETANEWDGHTPKDVTERLRRFLTPKPKYPKTYEECLSVLGIYNGLPDVEIYNAKPSECKLFESFIRLKRCRDAYWKIAGEEMGLGKPWEPNWSAKDNHFYTIHTFNGKIECSATAHRNAVLIFPTEEMRDAFYEAFKELIEQCKELL